jgi:hypothetical protein
MEKPQHKSNKKKRESTELIPIQGTYRRHDDIPEFPNKIEAYETYVTWKALPMLLKRPPRQKINGVLVTPDPVEFAMANGIEDEELLDLINIPTQNDFADKYRVDKDTLTRWNKLIYLRNPLEDSKRWTSKLVHNLLMSLYSNAMKGGNPMNYKLFLQVSANFEERQLVEHKFVPVETVEYQIIDHESNPQIK